MKGWLRFISDQSAPFSPSLQLNMGWADSIKRFSPVDNTALSFLLILVLGMFFAFLLWKIFQLFSDSGKIGSVGSFRKTSKKRLKDLALSHLQKMRANVEQVNTFFAMMGVSDDYIKVMQDSNIFEDYLERYKSVQKNQNKIQLAESLRDLFGFNFSNPGIAFSSSRMLPSKKIIRVYLSRGFKKVDYLSTVVRNEIEHFSILPPKRNGEWVNVSSLKEAEIRVYRDNDGEYQFFSPIKWQSQGDIPLVYLGHTNKIIKIFARYFKRYPLELRCRVSRISESDLVASTPVDVKTKDLSKGGVALWVPRELTVQPNDILEINFVDRRDFSALYGRVLSYTPPTAVDKALVNVEFTGITEVERILIERFIKDTIASNPNLAALADA